MVSNWSGHQNIHFVGVHTCYQDFSYTFESWSKILKLSRFERKFCVKVLFICVLHQVKVLKSVFIYIHGGRGCGQLIWMDEISTEKISNAISVRRNDGFHKDNHNFAASVESKLNAIRKKLDDVEQIPRKVFCWFLICCCALIVAYMVGGK